MLRKLFNDETGAVVSAELVLVLTITFTAAAVGLSAIGAAVSSELDDVSDMLGAVDQTYSYASYQTTANTGGKGVHGRGSPSAFTDIEDDCDCADVVRVETCGKTQTAGTVNASFDGGADGN